MRGFQVVYWYVLQVYYLNDQETYKASLLHPSNPERIWREHYGSTFGRIHALRNYTQQVGIPFSSFMPLLVVRTVLGNRAGNERERDGQNKAQSEHPFVQRMDRPPTRANANMDVLELHVPSG